MQLSSITAEEGGKDQLSADLGGIAGADEAGIIQFKSMGAKTAVMRQGLTGLSSDTISDAVVELVTLEDDFGSSPALELNDTLLLSMLPPDQNISLKDYLSTFGIKQEELHKYLSSFESTRDRVNRWLLHQLRLSRYEIFYLQRAVLISAPEVEDWANIALKEWSSDNIGQEQSYVYGSIEDDTSMNAVYHNIFPHLDELAQEYLNRNGDGPSPFRIDRQVASIAPDVHSQMLLQRTDQSHRQVESWYK
ncbi:hypothetical protein DE146DRAFT_751552 [Phaeosphaeria sp. MPI-PUGE-AT-0046c]|nr:hypothetical protein DE146DRAFT_751552 [Phaeosphaeria sp. MPI-PUGE-AT-0046c]